jgi:hypothetical protein
VSTDPQFLTDSQASAEAARLIAEAYRLAPVVPTSYRDDSPVPAYGTTPPVPQPDSRIVPPWALGIAVASVGVGAGVTGIGCGAWLVLQGLAAVTLTGVLAVTLPIAAAAALVTAIGGAFARVRRSSTTHVYRGTVVQRTEVTATARGLLSRAKAGR